MPITQDNRFIAIDTAFGKDKLLLVRFTCREAVSRLYEIDAEVTSEDFKVDFDKILGTATTIKVMRGDGAFRYFSGVVSRFIQTTGPGDHAHYEMRIVPWFWLLTRTADCRIFQNKSIPDIVKAIFDLYPFADVKFNLTGEYKPKEYQVQYRETDFNFVSRLLEQEGISYFFEHDEKGKHTLHVVDAPTSFLQYKGYEKIDWAATRGAALDKQVIHEWTYEKSVQPAKYATIDYNFETPSTPLLAPAQIPVGHVQKDFEVFDAPGEYLKKAEGDEIAKIRLQELQSSQEIATGSGNTRGICAGYSFQFGQLPRDDWKDKKWLVTEAVHRAVSDPFIAHGSRGEDEYSCRFSVVNAETLWRPSRLTPKPSIPGPQTAMVCGPKGNDIHTDQYGRVKVKFHWDRESKGDENSSCWIRVAQHWAGKQFGTMMIPRTGHEVIVEFLEGDPDRPIITGRVYNAETMPPYKLPDMATVSTWKSLSSPDGGGFNEIRFEDKKGKEMLFVHAQKDQDIRVLHDQKIFIGHNQHIVVKKDLATKVENNVDTVIEGDSKTKITKDDHHTIAGLQAIKITKSRSTTIEDDVIDVFKKNHSEEVTKEYYLKADQIVIEGMSNVTIKVGDNSIAIDSSGIGLKCAQFKLDVNGTMELSSKGPASVKSSATMDVEGATTTVKGSGQLECASPATTVKGDGMLTLKGGLVMIN
jgi:type VI secretion system secreted protein VgrG